MVKVKGQQQIGGDVDECDQRIAEARDDIVVDLTTNEIRIRRSYCEIQQVVKDKEREDRAAPHHRTRCIVQTRRVETPVLTGRAARLRSHTMTAAQMCTETQNSITDRKVHRNGMFACNRCA